jgi:hypothetical protein
MGAGIIVLIIFKYPLIFHISIGFLVIETIENIAITLILTKQKTDIHSIWHALAKKDFP